MKRMLLRGLAIIMTVLLVAMGLSVTVKAESVVDRLIAELKESMKEAVNASYLSAEKIMIGDSITMVAQAEGVNPNKCEYGFYVRVKGLFWMTLQKYSPETVVVWTPDAVADYEVCIKVKHNAKITKKYFDVRVTQPLKERSYVSTSYIQQGEFVDLTGLAEGGFGELSYGFFYKPTDEDSWTTLSDYSTASNLRWRPLRAGTYDICINVLDEDGQQESKWASLTVASPTAKTPEVFTVTVKSPISSPYFWQCRIDDENLIGYEAVEQAVIVEDLKTYVLREYRFTTLSAGRTAVRLTYDTHSGQQYTLVYDITVDKNLNYTINASEGNYFEKEPMPAPEQITGSFSIHMPEDTAASRWKCELSDNLVVETDSTATRSGTDDVISFTVLREGHFTVTLRCTSGSSTTDKYHLIYNLYADPTLTVTLIDRDGYYEENSSWPEVL